MIAAAADFAGAGERIAGGGRKGAFWPGTARPDSSSIASNAPSAPAIRIMVDRPFTIDPVD
jgi:hypothetical protein